MLNSERRKLKFLIFDITEWPKTAQFFILSAGIFVFYVSYGYLQELVFRLPGMKPYGWYLTLIQFLLYSLFSCTEMVITATSLVRRIPLKTYMQIAFYTVATIGLSNASLGYLNYPTQIAFKCCKLIPVLIGGIIIQGKRYGLFDLLATALMSIGLIMFTLADNKISPVFNLKGYILITLALVADAIIGNVQEKAMKGYNASNEEVVLYSYSIGSVYLLLGTLLTGEFFHAFSFFAEHPRETYGYIFFLSALGYLGINIVLSLLRVVGALLAVTVTTMRKAVTIVFSFYFFSKPFTVTYVWAGMILLFAIYLNIYGKNKSIIDSKVSRLLLWIKLNLHNLQPLSHTKFERKLEYSV